MPVTTYRYTRNAERYAKSLARSRFRTRRLPGWLPGTQRKIAILTEGDSWFDYPLKSLSSGIGFVLRFFTGLQGFDATSKTNVIDCLVSDSSLNSTTLRIERSGDHADELSAKTSDKTHGVMEERLPSPTLYAVLKNKDIGQNLDCILLSAGGNDLINHMRRHVMQDYCGSAEQSIDVHELRSMAQRVVQHYLNALLYRDEFAPQAHVICHSYAYPIHLYSGTSFCFDINDIGLILGRLFKLIGHTWTRRAFATIGVDINEQGQIFTKDDANLHESFDKKGWPSNPQAVDGKRIGVHAERAYAIRLMLDVLMEEMSELPELYRQRTGQDLDRFHYIDLRNEVQKPEYWADFIHLNDKGCTQVVKRFLSVIEKLDFA
ncbi:hypothetical protein HF888_14440 [Bermanella marisrubri]|uniref:SGNH hydrolase-type esterase domain-containing protein n=1 Tax=Bermanella marisrubri TaxID=207949 RepID=Q1N2A8_9GAMM|nr:hypothetical protein [Bermanella marisrubri]EAT12256.1 hypothetical protein RED65_15493 [Bermanella marisrubri]QIZ85348.1 hypothetical protein HF888_14440 [Bermanella marisrubri]